MHDHLREWIALSELPGIGPAGLLRLMQPESGCSAAQTSLLQLSHNQLQSLNLPARTIHHIRGYQKGEWPDREYLQEIDRWLQQPCNHLVTFICDRYPPFTYRL